MRPLGRTRVFALRHAVLSLARPGNQTRVILLAVGLGAFFILGVRLVQATLLDQFSLDLRPDAPDMFLLDVQRDQVADVERVIRDTPGASGLRLIPVLRARVTGVRGATAKVDGVEGVQGRQGLGREFVITYRERLEANETLLDGAMWAAPVDGMAEVSIEESLRRNAGLQMGDIVRFDVLGRVIEAKVTSVRDVDWNDVRSGGFMFVFRPGLLEKAPHGFMGVLRAPDSPDARARLQRDLVAAHSNVSAVDVREVVKAAQGILGNVTLAITAVGGLALFSGILIVIGSVAMTRFQRLYESAILKTLGATPRTMMAMVAMEYLGLGALGGLVGAARGARPQLGRVAVPVRDAVAAGAADAGARHRAHVAGGGGGGRPREPRRRPPAAAGGAPRRVARLFLGGGANMRRLASCRNRRQGGSTNGGYVGVPGSPPEEAARTARR